MIKQLLILPICLAALTAGCGTKPQVLTSDAPPGAVPVNSFSTRWTTSVDPAAGEVTQIYLRDNLLFAYTTSGQEYVIDRATGQIRHIDSVRTSLIAVHPPVVLKDTILYPTLNTFEIFTRDGGRFLNSVRLPLAVRTSTVTDHGNLFLGADYQGGGRLVRIDANRAYVPIVWSLMFPNSTISSTPALSNDTVFAGSEGGQVCAVATDNREPIWSIDYFQTSGPIFADLRADESGVYVACMDSKFYCINRSTGKVKWQYFASVPLRATPELTSDLVYELVDGAGLVALDKAPAVVTGKPSLMYDRSPRWTLANGAQFLAEDKDNSYIALTDHSLAAIDKNTGQIAFTSKRNDFTVFTSNTGKDSTIYAVAPGGRIYAIMPVIHAGVTGSLVEANPPRSPQEPNSVALAN